LGIHKSSRLLGLLVILCCLLATGCETMPERTAAPVNVGGTPVPTPTPDPSGYQAILEPEACMIADWITLQTSDEQGDLIAWQPHQADAAPGVSNLAFLGPTDKSAWYTGELLLAIGPKFKEQIPLAPNTLATGDLTWSPAGDLLAFVAYRPNEGLYTAMVAAADGSRLTDLFPAELARTDTRSGKKAIIGWKDNRTVQVMASCGEECRQAFDFQIDVPPGPVLTPTVIANYRELNENLAITRRELAYQEGQFPKIMNSPHWSPDETKLTYLDKRGLLWLLSIETKIMYPLEIGLREVYETQWSTTSDAIAIRAEDRIFVFEIPCRQ